MKFTTRVKPVKIRIISGGEEHSNLDTLKRNFSITDIIELVKDNRLSTWLRRIKANEIANRLEELKNNISSEENTESFVVKLSSIIFGTDFSTTFDLKQYWKDNNYTKNLEYQESFESKNTINNILCNLGEKNLFKKVREIMSCLDKIIDSQQDIYKKLVLDSFNDNLRYTLYKELQTKEEEDKLRIENFFSALSNPEYELRYNQEQYLVLLSSFNKDCISPNYLINLIRCLTIINNQDTEKELQNRIENLDMETKSKCVKALAAIKDEETTKRILCGIYDLFFDIEEVINKGNVDVQQISFMAAKVIKANWNSNQFVLESMIDRLSAYYIEDFNQSEKEQNPEILVLISILAIHSQIKGFMPRVGVLKDIDEKDAQKWRKTVLNSITCAKAQINRIKSLLEGLCLNYTNVEYYAISIVSRKVPNTQRNIFINSQGSNDKCLLFLPEKDISHEFKATDNIVSDEELDGCLKFIIDNFISII